jgi:hypothetical protein
MRFSQERADNESHTVEDGSSRYHQLSLTASDGHHRTTDRSKEADDQEQNPQGDCLKSLAPRGLGPALFLRLSALTEHDRWNPTSGTSFNWWRFERARC